MKTFMVIVPNLLFGPGSINQMASMINNELHFGNVAIITDSFLLQSGCAAKVIKPLEEQGIKVSVFGEVLPSPTKSNALAAYEFLKDSGAQAVIGLGGGSAMDVAKIAAMLITNPPPIEKYFDKGGLNNPGLPCITIPTTAGTGAESSRGGVLADDETHIKGTVAGYHAAPIMSVVDPELQISLPPNQTAATGMDALTHAIEGYTSKKESMMGDLYASKAIELIGANIRTAYNNGNDMEARYNMAFAALIAGYTMQASSTAANHALAYSIESRVRIPHGVANAVILPSLIRFSASGNIPKYKQIAVLLGENIAGLSDREAALKAANAVEALNKDLNMPTLREIGIKEEDFPEMAKAAVSMRRLIDPNPRDITEEQAVLILRNAL